MSLGNQNQSGFLCLSALGWRRCQLCEAGYNWVYVISNATYSHYSVTSYVSVYSVSLCADQRAISKVGVICGLENRIRKPYKMDVLYKLSGKLPWNSQCQLQSYSAQGWFKNNCTLLSPWEEETCFKAGFQLGTQHLICIKRFLLYYVVMYTNYAYILVWDQGCT